MSSKPNYIRLLSGARGRNRTTDTRIFNFSRLLCKLYQVSSPHRNSHFH